jgi:hypothetical protein
MRWASAIAVEVRAGSTRALVRAGGPPSATSADKSARARARRFDRRHGDRIHSPKSISYAVHNGSREVVEIRPSWRRACVS